MVAVREEESEGSHTEAGESVPMDESGAIRTESLSRFRERYGSLGGSRRDCCEPSSITPACERLWEALTEQSKQGEDS